MADSLYVNGRSVESLGLMPERYTPYQFPGFQWLSEGISQRAGSLLVDPSPRVGDRRVELVGTIFSSSVASLDSTIRAILSWVSMPFLELSFTHDLTKVVYARLEKPEIMVEDPQLDTQYANVKLTFVAHNPYAFDLESTVLGIGQDRRPIPMGTASVTGIIRLMAGASQVLTLRAANGEVIQTLTTSATTTDPTTYVTLNGLTLQATTTASGSTTTTNSIIPTTTDWPLFVNPRYRDPDASVESTLEVDNGMAEFLYRRAWG